MNAKTVSVALGARSYNIHIGANLLGSAAVLIEPFTKRKKLAVVTEKNVAGNHLNTLKSVLENAGYDCQYLILDPGEATKDWINLQKTVEWLLAQRIERDDLVVAFGGGVIGDLVGFAAAILRRGVRFIQIPTSLLAQVDSSVGGKTGINSLAGKNLIGAFHQPILVIADISVLNTLTQRDFLSGYGEVAKYGLLGDETFFEWLESRADAISRRDEQVVAEAVQKSCQMKADTVAKDEHERGERALLNLGHTFGHALEAATGYSNRLLHGEGVAIGCGLAFEMSMRLNLCAQECPSRVRAHFKSVGLKTDLADIPGVLPSADELIKLMAQDKKVQDGRVTFILSRAIGEAFIESDVDIAVVRAVLEDALSMAKNT